MQVITGNIVALIASIIMVYTGYIKSKNKIIFVQTIQIILMVISNFILGGLTGAISNVIGCVRNILCYKDKLNNIAKGILIILAIIFSLGFNNLGLLGFLPLISTVVYIILMDLKDVIKFKYLIIFTMILWFVYDLYIKSYTSACFDFMTIVVSIVSIIQIKRKIIVNKLDSLL